MEEGKAKAEGNSRRRYSGTPFLFLVLLTSQILSQWGPVTERERLGQQPSRYQCCPVGPRCAQWPQGPVSALYLLPASPKGWLKEVRGSHPQGQLGGRQGLQERSRKGGMRACPGKWRASVPGRASPPSATLPLRGEGGREGE